MVAATKQQRVCAPGTRTPRRRPETRETSRHDTRAASAGSGSVAHVHAQRRTLAPASMVRFTEGATDAEQTLKLRVEEHGTVLSVVRPLAYVQHHA